MAVVFAHLSWLVWSGKQREPKISKGSSLSTSPELALWELDATKFPLVKGSNIASSSRKNRRKWHSREERKVDREYDVVVVPSDGGCVSGSESDDSDWSIGWLEPHGPGFPSDDETDNNFAVLVPCYGRVRQEVVDRSQNKILDTMVSFQDNFSSESKKVMEQWLSSLQNS